MKANGPPFVLDAAALYTILSDPGFYAAVPAFYFLKLTAEPIVARIAAGNDGVPREGCVGCGSLRAQMAPLSDAFARQARNLAADAPDALRPLIDYVEAKRKRRPESLFMYWKDAAGVTRRLEIK